MTMYRSSRAAECSPLQALGFILCWIALAVLIWTHTATYMVPGVAAVLGSFLGFWLMVFLTGLASAVILSVGLIGICIVIEMMD